MMKNIESDKRKILISVISGLICFLFSPYGIQIVWDSITISMPWSIIFPILISMVYGWKFGLIAGLSGGALYPFYLWFNNGYANLSTAIIYLVFYSILGLVSDKKVIKNIKNLDFRLIIVSAVTLLLFKFYYTFIFNIILSLNPPFWNVQSISYLSPDILNGLFVKSCINFIVFVFISNTLMKIPIIRQFFGLEILPEMKNNAKILIYSTLTVFLVWSTYLLLANSLLPGENILKQNHIQLAFIVIIATGFIVAKIIIYFSENEIRNRLELIKAKEKAEENEHKYRMLFDSNKDSISILSIDSEGKPSKFIEFNRAVCDVFGYNREELMQKNLEDLEMFVSESVIDQRIETINNFGSVDFETVIKNKAGSDRYVDVKVKKIVYQNQPALMNISRDITERKQAEFELAETVERYKSLHNASFGGIAIHDKGVILECNQGLSDMTGYTLDELIGMDGLLLIAPEHRDMVLNKIVTGFEKPYEANGLRKNGDQFPMRLEARNVPFKGKNVRTVEFRDISESKEAEKALLSKMNELERFHKITIDRELTMIELKKEINNLLNELGRENKYTIFELKK